MDDERAWLNESSKPVGKRNAIVIGMLCVALGASLLFGFLAYRSRTATTSDVVVGEPKWLATEVVAPYVVILPNGRPEVRTRTIKVRTAESPAFEQPAAEVANDPVKSLRFWLLMGFSIFYGVYVLYVAANWVRYDIKGGRGQHALKTERRLDAILAFALGAIAGVVANANLGAASEEVRQSDAIDTYEAVRIGQQEQIAKLINDLITAVDDKRKN